jgi:hypothetical protein
MTNSDSVCSRVHLRLVSSEEDKQDRAEVLLKPPPPNSKSIGELMMEAEAIEIWHGLNAYSDFIRKHGRRPDRKQAATIGRLLGGRVAADDGSMQPPLSKADRDVIRDIKARRKAASRRYDHILRLRNAIAALSENEDDPAEVIGHGSCLLDGPAISAQLDIALCWLNRFAQEWHSREKKAGAAGSKPVSGDQGEVGA